MISHPTLFPGRNSLNIVKSNRVFPGMGKEYRALILTYLVSLMAEVFAQHCLCFLISVIFRGERVVKVGPKVQTLGPSPFHKNSNPSKTFQTVFLFDRVLLLVRILAILDYIWGIKSSKTSQEGHFVDAESVRKTLKIFNLKPKML